MNSPALRNPQHGVTMLEVLIAIVVLSFGMLGMLGLLTNGLKMTSSSQYRTIAAQQLTAIADMISANPDISFAYAALPSNSAVTSNCLTATGCATSVSTTTTTTGTPPVTTTTTSISPNNNFPKTDYALWKRDLAMLPQGVGVVCLDSTPADGVANGSAATLLSSCDNSGRLTVKICWNEQGRVAISGGGGSGGAASASAQDTCLVTQL